MVPTISTPIMLTPCDPTIQVCRSKRSAITPPIGAIAPCTAPRTNITTPSWKVEPVSSNVNQPVTTMVDVKPRALAPKLRL